jgi:serine/threonine protein kinase
LADLGGAIICSPRDSEEIHKKKWESSKWIENQKIVVTLLTLFQVSFSPGYVAPDVERFWQNTAADVIPARDTKPGITSGDIPKRITTATNIWNVGMIMADLMSPHRFRRPNWNHLAYSARETWLDNFINQIDTDPSMKDYSKLLKDTVIQCVNYIPDQRPTPTDLLARVGHGVDLHCGPMQTRKCLDTTTYNGRYDLDLSAPFSDDYPITQPDDWIMADNDDEVFASAEPPGAGGPLPAKPQAEARQSKTTKAGAPQDTPHKEFLVGPNAGESTRNFFDDESDYEAVEKPAPPHGFVRASALRQALIDDMMDSQSD